MEGRCPQLPGHTLPSLSWAPGSTLPAVAAHLGKVAAGRVCTGPSGYGGVWEHCRALPTPESQHVGPGRTRPLGDSVVTQVTEDCRFAQVFGRHPLANWVTETAVCDEARGRAGLCCPLADTSLHLAGFLGKGQ